MFSENGDIDLSKANPFELEIAKALDNNEFVLYYQPEFNLSSAKFEGVEALIRWNHPDKGLLLPADFILVAEQSNLITSIGKWVLKTACEQVKDWHQKGLTPMRMAVNVAGRQFYQKDFVSYITNLLQQLSLDPTYLELELNENIIIEGNDKKLIDMIYALTDKGIQITLDDFGSGYSSIKHLKQIPVHRIKIDKTFIDNINFNNHDTAVVCAIMALAESLNLQVLAEGVETYRQLQVLLAQNCKEVQGFFFSHPLPAAQLEQFLMYYQEKPFF